MFIYIYIIKPQRVWQTNGVDKLKGRYLSSGVKVKIKTFYQSADNYRIGWKSISTIFIKTIQ